MRAGPVKARLVATHVIEAHRITIEKRVLGAQRPAARRRPNRMRRTAILVMLVAAIGGVAACGQAVAPGAGGTNPGVGSGSGDDGAVQGVGTVLESPDHGPQLCLGGVMDSYPPQCEGVDLVGWDWTAADGEETANGTSWGSYAVTGTWDGTRLTVTAVGAPEAAAQPPVEDQNFMTPCDPPAGGWVVVDADTATDEAMQRALADASAEADYAGAWVDQSINPASDDGAENELNDPTKLVLNVMFTGDLDRHEAEIRAVWGGPLCVSSAPRSQSELLEIQAALTSEPGVLGSAPDDRAGTLEVSVVVDDGLQARMDQTYGPGVVVVMPALVPVG